jgi:hypothetical protein
MCVEVKCRWVKCSEDLSNRVSNIIRRYIDHMKCAACMAFPVITLFYIIFVLFGITLYIWLYVLCASV